MLKVAENHCCRCTMLHAKMRKKNFYFKMWITGEFLKHLNSFVFSSPSLLVPHIPSTGLYSLALHSWCPPAPCWECTHPERQHRTHGKMQVPVRSNANRFYNQQLCSMYSSCSANSSFLKVSEEIPHDTEQGPKNSALRPKACLSNKYIESVQSFKLFCVSVLLQFIKQLKTLMQYT